MHPTSSTLITKHYTLTSPKLMRGMGDHITYLYGMEAWNRNRFDAIVEWQCEAFGIQPRPNVGRVAGAIAQAIETLPTIIVGHKVVTRREHTLSKRGFRNKLRRTRLSIKFHFLNMGHENPHKALLDFLNKRNVVKKARYLMHRQLHPPGRFPSHTVGHMVQGEKQIGNMELGSDFIQMARDPNEFDS